MDNVNKKFNHIMLANLEKYPDVRVECHLQKVADDRKLTLKEISLMTGIRPNTIYRYANRKTDTLTFTHLILLMTTLHITDITELFSVEMDDETYEKLSKEWEMTGEIEIGMEHAREYMRKQ